METKLQQLLNLLKSDNSYKDVLDSIDNLQDMDKYLLENFNPKLVGLYARLNNITDISDIYELIPYDHKIIDKLPDENRKLILDIVYSYNPKVDVYPEIRKPDLNILRKAIELRKEFNRPYERRSFPYQTAFEISDNYPVHNSRSFLLAKVFGLDLCKVYESKLPNKFKASKLLEDVFANFMLRRFDIYGDKVGVNTHIHNFLQQFSRANAEPQDLLLPLKNLKAYLSEYKLLDDDISNFLGMIGDSLQSRSIDDYLLDKGYGELRPIVDGSCCSQTTMISSGCRDRKISYDYVSKELRPLLTTLTPFKVPPQHSETVHLFLDAFPYHHYHYCYIDYDENQEYVKFEPKKMKSVPPNSATIKKFTSLLTLTNLNLPYQILFDLTKTINFTINECMSLFHYILDFKNYICAFLASMVCQHNVNIFDIVNTRLQYQLVKCLPQDIHITMQTDICKYAPNNSRLITLHSIYQSVNINFELADFSKFVRVVEHIKLIARNKAQLYLMCSQINFSEFYVYEYLRKYPTIDSLTSIILARILLGNPQISDAERNVLHYYCNSTYTYIPPVNMLGFPDTPANKRKITNYDYMTLEDYFSLENTDNDIPLIVEEVPIQKIESHLTNAASFHTY